MRKLNKRLGEILMDKGLITSEQLSEALTEQQRTKEFLGQILIRRNYIKERDLLKALSEQFGIPLGKLKNKYIHWELVKQFSPSLILDYKCFPVEEGEYSITVAILNPLDAWALKKVEEEAKGLRPKFVLVSQDDMNEAMQRYKQYILDEISKQFE